MDEKVPNDGALIDRIQQLERERDELRKDIEQLCFQQAGPGYLVVATRMHFQRTAGLEQEIENLKKRLAACTRDNQNLQEELSEVYHIKTQLADLHSAEIAKNLEAERQVKFFHGCVAAAFAERDHSLMEAEKAKEREEDMSQKINGLQKRIEELTSDCLEEKKLNASLKTDLEKLEEQNENFKKVIDKFYDIRERSVERSEFRCWDDKCFCLLQDPAELWSFDDHSEASYSKYIGILEEELEKLRNSVGNLQNKLQMGLEIEDHLKKKVCELKKNLSYDTIKKSISDLHNFHTQQRCEIINVLEEEKAQFKSMFDIVQQQIRHSRLQNTEPVKSAEKFADIECRDVHMTSDGDQNEMAERNGPTLSNIAADGTGDTSDALAQALQEKVAALLLMSQQEERYLLERNVHAALQKKMEELQRNFLQVTNEKVNALMELAQLRQEYKLLQVNNSHGIKQGPFVATDKVISGQERDGKLKNLLKKTYLRRWVDRQDLIVNEADTLLSNEGNSIAKKFNYSVDYARMKVEYATLKESMGSIEHLTSCIHRLRLSLKKARDASVSQDHVSSITEALDGIVSEAKLLKMALGSSLPVSWSAEADSGSLGGNGVEDSSNGNEELVREKVDSVSAAGFEMVELLIMAAQLLKENMDMDLGNKSD